MESASSIKNITTVDKTRWHFPTLSKIKLSPYSSKLSRELRVKEIVEELNKKTFVNNYKNWLYEKAEEIKLHEALGSFKVPPKKKFEEDMSESRDSDAITVKTAKNIGAFIDLPSSKIKDSENIRKEETTKNVAIERYSISKSKSFIETSVLERKYFKKWHDITKKKVLEKKASFKKQLFERNIVEPVDLEEELWKKWKQIKEEIKQMKAVLFLHWTTSTNVNNSFEYLRYVREYGRNPLKWMDSEHSLSSRGLQMEGLRRWMKIEENFHELKENMMKKITGFQDCRDDYAQTLFKKRQREYFHKIEEIKRKENFRNSNTFIKSELHS